MIQIQLIVFISLLSLTTAFKLQQEIIEKYKENIKTNYTSCQILPHSGAHVNNNSMSTAVPNPKQFMVAVSGRQPYIYLYPIRQSSQGKREIVKEKQQNIMLLNNNPNKDQCINSSAVDLSDDGMFLAYGCGSSDLFIYEYQTSGYLLKQVKRNSYNADGGKIFFSSDAHRLFTTQSLRQINYYQQGANLYNLVQTINVNLNMKNFFTMARNAKYFATIEKDSDSIFLAVFQFSKNDNNTYVRLPHTQPIDMIVADIFMNDRFIGVVSSTSVAGCSVVIYKITPDGKSFLFEQQITQNPSNLCARSGTITYRNQMVLTFPNGKSYLYQYVNNNKKFIKQDEIVNQIGNPNIFTEVRLIDTVDEHLLIYTNVGFNLYCPKV